MSTKSDVLSMLEQDRGRPVSGQQIAESLNISRSAVWKAIQALRREGHRIDAGTNKGYRLMQGSGLLSAEGIRLHLAPEYQASAVMVYPVIDSTNTQAKRMALDGAPHGTILIAEEQTSGRGRFGRSFFSPRHTGIYMSMILRPGTTLADTQTITVAAAVVVCNAVEGLDGPRLGIKWVNDLYLGGKKVGGILTEAAGVFESGRIESVILGIGLNCTTAESDFPAELRAVAGSLNALELSRNRLAADIATGILSYAEHPDVPSMIGEYRRRSLMPGREIQYERAGKSVAALVLDISETGSLIVRTREGDLDILSSGEVTITGKWT